MTDISFTALGQELGHALDGYQGGAGVPALEHGRRVLGAMLRHPDWPSAPASDQARNLQDGGALLLFLYKHTGEGAVITDTVSVLTVCANLMDETDPERPDVLANLGLALRNAAERESSLPMFQRAVQCIRASLAATSPDDSDYPRRLSNLGSALRAQYALSGDLSVLNDAIDAFEAGCERSAAQDLAANLAVALRDRHERTGSRVDLERALALASAAVEATPHDHPARPTRLNNLGILLGGRFLLDGRGEDARRAVDVLTEAVDLTPEGAADRAYRLGNLGNQYAAIFHRNADRRMVEEAVRVYAEAVATANYGPEGLAALKTSYAGALAIVGELGGDAEQMAKAVSLARDALAACGPGAANRAAFVNSLVEALRSQGRGLRQAGPLEAALAELEAALAEGGDTPATHKLRLGQAGTLKDLYGVTQAPEHARRSASLARTAVRQMQAHALAGGVQTADIELAARAAMASGVMSARLGDLTAAAEHFESARAVRLSAEAASADRVPAGLDEQMILRWRQLQAGVRQARVRLEAGAAPDPADQAERAQAAAMLDQCLESLRRLAADEVGLSAMLSIDDLQSVAAQTGSALIYIYGQELEGGALVVTAEQLIHIDMPALSDARARLHAGSEADRAMLAAAWSGGGRTVGWVPAYRMAHGVDRVEGGQAVWRDVMVQTLDWLGQACATPLAAALKGLDAHRAVLMASDDLALLPLHAAPVAGDLPLMAHASCRYAPSAALLSAALARAPQSADLAAAADADDDLPFARLEGVLAIARGGDCVLGAQATRERVVEMLGRASRTHLAIHGSFDGAAPLDSALWPANDQPIRLSQLLSGEVVVRAGATVVASACETGVFNSVVGAAEQVGFSAAFLMAGARTVISTLWPVNDLSSALLMDQALLREAEGIPFAEALALAIGNLREATGAQVAADLRRLAVRAGDVGAAMVGQIEQVAQDLEGRVDAPFAHPAYWAAVVVSGAD